MITTALIITVMVALIFEYTNGWHDTANSIATSIGTKALTARQAIILAAGFNLIGALVSSNVAKTISSGLIFGTVPQIVITAGLLGAIGWNLFTWKYGIPSSSSHAMIGGLLGASAVYANSFNIIQWNGVLMKVLLPLIVSPLLGFTIAFIVAKLLNNLPESSNKYFRWIQIASAAFLAYSHGNNDSQKAMGIITLALVSAGVLGAGASIPTWVVLTCAITMAVGTSVGGWRIINTMAFKISELNCKQGTIAETSAGLIIEMASKLGIPTSTTHCISSAIIGVGTTGKMADKGWETVTRMLITWGTTLPVTATLGAIIYWILS